MSYIEFWLKINQGRGMNEMKASRNTIISYVKDNRNLIVSFFSETTFGVKVEDIIRVPDLTFHNHQL